MKVFDAIMTEGSITRAAARLYVTQPAISNALNRLRALHGDELFVRTTKGVAPTPKAREIAGTIEKALQLVESTFSVRGDFQPDASHREFTIALTDYGELHFLPRLMKKLSEIAPGTSVTCLPTPGASLAAELKSGTVDLVWDWVKIANPHYRSHVVFKDRSYCIARRNHPKIGGHLTLDVFLGLEHVSLRPTSTHIPMIEHKLEERGLEREVVVEVSHLLAMPAIVAQTDLVATLPERLAFYYARQLDLAIWPNPVFDDAVPVYQMWHKHFDDDPGHRWLRETLADLARFP